MTSEADKAKTVTSDVNFFVKESGEGVPYIEIHAYSHPNEVFLTLGFRKIPSFEEAQAVTSYLHKCFSTLSATTFEVERYPEDEHMFQYK